MGGGHGHSHVLFVHADSGVHRLAPECKVVATVLFVLAVVATPREAFWAFGVDAAILIAVALVARVPLLGWGRRCLIEVPFLLFAVFLPLLGTAPYIQVGPLALSEPGLWGAWNVAVKGTLGVAASALLTATSTVPDLLRALERLRVPRPLVAIATFMIRYGEVLSADLARMRIARISRGDDPRWIWQVRALDRRCVVRPAYEGERVYVAMLARGYGFGPAVPAVERAPGRAWATALALPAAAGLVCAAALATA